MRRGVALCHHLWRNDVACEETLVVADAQEDRGFDRDPDVTVFVEGGGSWDEVGDGFGDGFGNRFGSGNGIGDADRYIDSNIDGDGFEDEDGNGNSDGEGDGDGFLMGDGCGTASGDGDGRGTGDGFEFKSNWIPGTLYLFPDEAQEAPCDAA